MTDKKQLGVDDGHFGIKAVNGKTLYIPSRIISGNYPYISLTSDENVSFVYEVDSKQYTVVERPSLNSGHRFLQTRTDDFPSSDMNLILVYHALVRAGVDGDCSICTGLPFNQFYTKTGQKNKALIESKKQSFTRVVTALNAVNIPIINEHIVCSEGVAGYFDLKYNQDGSVNEEFMDLSSKGLVCLVDIGGRTTNIIVIDNGAIDFSRSTTVDIGCLSLKDNFTSRLEAKLNTAGIPDKMVDEMMMQDGIYKDKNIDASDILNPLKVELAVEIVNNVKHKIKNNADLALIAFIGGGSVLLMDQLKKLYDKSLVKFVKDPVNSNARGMQKLLKYGA